MTGPVQQRTAPSKALAWRCPTCTRLTIRLDHQPTPQLCDAGCGPDAPPLEQIPLTPPRRPR